jgi:adhesin/invasin
LATSPRVIRAPWRSAAPTLRPGCSASYTFTAADAGVHTFTVTFKTASKQTFTVQDTANVSLAGVQTLIDVVAGTATHIVISTPSNISSGTAFSVKVNAADAYGNDADTYVGTIHFTTTAKGSSVPIDYTFTAADKGIHTFLITLNSTGAQTLTVTDGLNAFTTTASATLASATAPPAGGGGGGTKTTPPVAPPVAPPVKPPVTPPATPPATPPVTPPVLPPVPKAPGGGTGGGKKPVV